MTIIPHDRIIKTSDIADLLFGQQHILTQFFFVSHFGQYHSIRIKDLPHYRFLVEQPEDPYSNNVYVDYLKTSWSYYFREETIDNRRFKEHIDKYINLYNDIKKSCETDVDPIREPIRVCVRPDGNLVVIDGNHRACIALKLGLDIRAITVNLSDELMHILSVPDEFYGTKRLNKPYQSLYHNGVELVEGRRIDIRDRMDKIQDSDLVGQTVLDLGCNIGASCYIAAERGASFSAGIELSPSIASAAVRVNAYFAAPCYFAASDLSRPLDVLPKFDTVFCFSVVNHLTSNLHIVDTLRQVTGRVLYFEGHSGTTQADYDYLLNYDNFSTIDLIGYTHDGVHVNRSTRPLFRCEVKNRGQHYNSSLTDINKLFKQGSDLWLKVLSSLKEEVQKVGPVQLDEDIKDLIPNTDPLILVDEEQIRSELASERSVFPFIEKDGQYWGPPADDKVAIEEFDRLRESGAKYIVFTNATFWWLQYYKEWHSHLRENYPCILENERLIIFDIKTRNLSVESAH